MKKISDNFCGHYCQFWINLPYPFFWHFVGYLICFCGVTEKIHQTNKNKKKNYNKNEKGITTKQNRNNEKTESKETRNKVHIQRSWKVVSYRTEVKNRIKNYGFSNGVTRLANSVLMFLMIIYFELITWSFISLINLWVISAKIYFCPSLSC